MKRHQTRRVLLLFCFFLLIAFTKGEKLRHRRSLYNKVTGVYTSCGRQSLEVTVKTKLNFTGNLYARGYPTECRGKGEGGLNTTLVVSSQECGVKIISEEGGEHTYELLIYVQFDPFVQQVSDEQVHVTCAIDKSRDLRVTGRSSMNVFNDPVTTSFQEKHIHPPLSGRTPKLSTFGISDLYPSNILNLPSKLQQMVDNHFKTTPEEDVSTSTKKTPPKTDPTVSGNEIKLPDNKLHPSDSKTKLPDNVVQILDNKTLAPDNDKIPLMTTTEHLTNVGLLDPAKDEEKASEVTVKDLVTKEPLVRPKLPSHIVSSFINIEGSEDVVPYKGIFRASPKQKKKQEGEEEKQDALQTSELLEEEWKPLPPPPESLPKQLDKWKSLLEEEGNDEIVSGWLDIVRGDSPSSKPTTSELVVGETATLVVKVRRQPGTDTRIVSCKAHDGSGSNVQELIDEKGCSVDEEIMPEFRSRTLSKKEVLNFAPFKAFKFPDHDSLHFKCTVEICLGRCQQVKCGKSRRPRQAGSGFFLLNPLDEDDDERIFGQNQDVKAATTTKKTVSRNQFPVKSSTSAASLTSTAKSSTAKSTTAKSSTAKSNTPKSSSAKSNTAKSNTAKFTTAKYTTYKSPTTEPPTAKSPASSKRPSLLRTPSQKSKSGEQRTKVTKRVNSNRSIPMGEELKSIEVVDSVDVFNSVEVRAPGIDNQPRLIKEYRKAVRPILETNMKSENEEEVFCITSSKLLAAFGILITIFVLALLIALYWFVKDKLRRVRIKRNERLRTSQQFSRYPQLSQNRFQGVIDYTKFPHLASPYHRFPH